ncbi:MAG: JAB domain-containing protein [Candidatus Hodarchaeales archaeon]|jgi:DNA repair protein RadC
MDGIQHYLKHIFNEEKIEKLYQTYNSLQLTQATEEEISAIVGKRIGKQIYNIFKIRYVAIDKSKSVCISSSNDSYNCVRNLSQLDYEKFQVLCLNRANRLIKIVDHSNGGTAGTVVDVKRILFSAIQNKASAIILAHNHPSGNKQPSRADKEITKKIAAACKYMDISVLDHIIVAAEPINSYFSFADEGLL